MYPPQLYPGLTIQSRSAARRAARDLVMITMRTTRRRSNTGRLLTLGAMSGKGAEVRRFCFAAKILEEVDEDCGDGDGIKE